MMRKQRESETSKTEDQLEALYREIQARINDLEPGKLRAYNELLAKQRDLQERLATNEIRINEVNQKIAQYESDDRTNSHRKEFSALEKTFQAMRKEAESLSEELEIASLDPKEANAKFKARVDDFKQSTKATEERAVGLREDIGRLKRQLEELNSVTEEDSGEAAKYDLLVKRDQDMTAFMDKFDETRDGILADQQATQEVVVALLEQMSRDLEDSASMPSQEAHGEMEQAKTFKERNLATAQRTMESLQAERRKRERELDQLRTSEPKLAHELGGLREEMARMRKEMISFQDVDGLRRAFDATQLSLVETRHGYSRRRDAMRQQVQALSVDHEALRKTLSAHDVAKEIEETEKRLKHYERSIFELHEFNETKSRETEFEGVKASCLKLLDSMNSAAIKQYAQAGMPGRGGQAKW